MPLVWVDAFTPRAFGGNPAAVCILEHPAPATAMQSLATELGLSETAFVWPLADGFGLRWFTPEVEVDLCGHATVAAAHALAETGRIRRDVPVVFSTRSGRLTARRAGERIELELPADEPSSAPVPPALAHRWAVLGAVAGRDDLVIELADAQAVRETVPPLDEIAALPHRGVIVTAPGDGDGVDYVLRFFGPGVGVPEDPVTGSAQCVLAPFWSSRLGRARLEAAQLSARGGRLGVEVIADRVRVAGTAVTVLAGALSGDVARLLAGDSGDGRPGAGTEDVCYR